MLSSAKNQEDAEAALKSVSVQETLNESMEKLKSMVASLVEGPAAGFLNTLSAVVGDAEALKSIFYGISTILGSMSLMKLITGLASALVTSGALAATTAATASAITLGLGAIAIIGGIASIMGAVNSAKQKAKADAKVNDGIISPTGGMIVSGPEGSIQLNKKDSIIAGTNLGGGNSGGNGGGNNSSDIRELKNMVASIANRPIHVSIDGKKVIEATTGAQPNTVGDESRKNSYRIS